MTPKEFAEKYAGYIGRICRQNHVFYNRPITICGWRDYDCDGIYVLVYFNDDQHTITPVENTTKRWIYRNDINKSLYYFNVQDIELTDQLPDDCLNCGAKGNEPCKDNCPNK